jgi:hypothetical protein
LGSGEVDSYRAGTCPSEPRGEVRRAAAELDHVEPCHIA